MLKHEFEILTGTQVTDQEFNEVINPMYMNAGDMDKQAFCEEWKKIKDSEVLRNINDTACLRLRQLNEFTAVNKTMSKELDRLNGILKNREAKEDFLIAEYLIKQAELQQNRDFAREAIELIGMNKFIKIKLERGYTLYQKDKDYIIDLIGVENIQTVLETLEEEA